MWNHPLGYLHMWFLSSRESNEHSLVADLLKLVICPCLTLCSCRRTFVCTTPFELSRMCPSQVDNSPILLEIAILIDIPNRNIPNRLCSSKRFKRLNKVKKRKTKSRSLSAYPGPTAFHISFKLPVYPPPSSPFISSLNRNGCDYFHLLGSSASCCGALPSIPNCLHLCYMLLPILSPGQDPEALERCYQTNSGHLGDGNSMDSVLAPSRQNLLGVHLQHPRTYRLVCHGDCRPYQLDL